MGRSGTPDLRALPGPGRYARARSGDRRAPESRRQDDSFGAADAQSTGGLSADRRERRPDRERGPAGGACAHVRHRADAGFARDPHDQPRPRRTAAGRASAVHAGLGRAGGRRGRTPHRAGDTAPTPCARRTRLAGGRAVRRRDRARDRHDAAARTVPPADQGGRGQPARRTTRLSRRCATTPRRPRSCRRRWRPRGPSSRRATR